MNFPKFPHVAMYVGATACGKTEYLLRLLETEYRNHFENIIILCPTVKYNKTYLDRNWIFEDDDVFLVYDIEGNLNVWIKTFTHLYSGHETLFIIDDCSAEGEINKKKRFVIRASFQW